MARKLSRKRNVYKKLPVKSIDVQSSSTDELSVISPQHEQTRLQHGTMLVNSGRLNDAVVHFSKILNDNKDAPLSALIGRGTALALHATKDSLLLAMKDFTTAINRCLEFKDKTGVMGATLMNAYQRRSQTLMGLGYYDYAIADCSNMISLAVVRTDSVSLCEALQLRGQIFNNLSRFNEAAEDAKRIITVVGSKSIPNSLNYLRQSWNLLGRCLNSMGLHDDAISAYNEAIQIDGEFIEAIANCGQTFRELGNIVQAEVLLTKSLSLDRGQTFATGFHLRGITRHNAGRHVDAIADFSRALEINNKYAEVVGLRAISYLCIGQPRLAAADFSRLAEITNGYKSKDNRPLFHYLGRWYQWELCFWMNSVLDKRTIGNLGLLMDDEFSPLFKELYARREDPVKFNQLSIIDVESTKQTGNALRPSNFDESIKDVGPSDPSSKLPIIRMLEIVDRIGPRIQYHARGFYPNLRQHAMCGISVLHGAQTFANHLSSGWRDFVNIFVRWRQISEPNDPVFWIDQLSRDQFLEGFGSNTPMLKGQCVVVRYGCYADRAFNIMKPLLATQLSIKGDLLKACLNAKTVQELLRLVGKDFWILTPCKSLLRSGHKIEGSRITLTSDSLKNAKTDDEVLMQMNFGIKSAGTPERWEDYNKELSSIWEQIVQLSKTWSVDQVESLLILGLHFIFYWYNFMPLSRGSAAIGYQFLLSLLLAFGLEVTSDIPDGLQLDWEALLCPDPQQFSAQMIKWLLPNTTPLHENYYPVTDFKVADVGETLPTLRDRIALMNWICASKKNKLN